MQIEKDSDIVELWCGGRSLEKSRLITRLSGVTTPSSSFHCTFPFMTVVFYSDYAVSFSGIQASWQAGRYKCAKSVLKYAKSALKVCTHSSNL